LDSDQKRRVKHPDSWTHGRPVQRIACSESVGERCNATFFTIFFPSSTIFSTVFTFFFAPYTIFLAVFTFFSSSFIIFLAVFTFFSALYTIFPGILTIAGTIL